MCFRRGMVCVLVLAIDALATRSLDAQQSGEAAVGFAGAGVNLQRGPESTSTASGAMVTEALHPVRADRRTEVPATGSGRTAGQAKSKAEGESANGEGPTPVTVTHDKREGYVRIRTRLTHPQPNVRRALTTKAIDLAGPGPAEQRIIAAVAQPVHDFQFDETPLRDAIAIIRDTYEVPVQLDIKALEEAGIDLDTPVTADIADVSLRSALRLMLGNLDLTYLVKNEVLLVTTKEKAQENLLVKVYPLAPEIDLQTLIDLVQSTVQPTTWDTTGGQGAMRPLDAEFGTGLVVSQTEEVHEEIGACIAAFIRSDLTDPGEHAPVDPSALPTRLYVVDEQALVPELEKKLVTLCNAALGDAADPAAKVSTLGKHLVVQSRSRAFHNYAADVIRCLNGRVTTTTDYLGLGGLGDEAGGQGMMNGGMGMGGMGMGGGGMGTGNPVGGGGPF